jgi:uncharacterized protein
VYESAAVEALRLVRDQMRLAPTGFGTALCALDLYLGPTREVAVIGDPDDATTRTLAAEVTIARYMPNVALAVAAPDDEASRSAVALLADRVALEGRATAYVCERFACKLPVTTPEALSEQLIG